MSGLRYKALPGGLGPVFGILHDTLRVQRPSGFGFGRGS